jgi:hypothetical protein
MSRINITVKGGCLDDGILGLTKLFKVLIGDKNLSGPTVAFNVIAHKNFYFYLGT